jgi:hypothetical protein
MHSFLTSIWIVPVVALVMCAGSAWVMAVNPRRNQGDWAGIGHVLIFSFWGFCWLVFCFGYLMALAFVRFLNSA